MHASTRPRQGCLLEAVRGVEDGLDVGGLEGFDAEEVAVATKHEIVLAIVLFPSSNRRWKDIWVAIDSTFWIDRASEPYNE